MTDLSIETFMQYATLAGIPENVSRDVFNAWLDAGYTTEGVDPGDVLDLMTVSKTIPESYNNFIANFKEIKTKRPEITTVAEWMNARKQYKYYLQSFGLGDIATNEYADQFLNNGVSVNEAVDRLNTAYYAVINADSALKEQLKTYFPSVTNADLVKNILGVGKTTEELKKQIGMAGIQAEAATAGVTSVLGAQELYAQGVTREAARKGFQTIAQSGKAIEQAASRAGIDTQGLQTELEKEQLLGLASQRRKQAQTAEQNIFSGQSGTANISLGKTSAGAIQQIRGSQVRPNIKTTRLEILGTWVRFPTAPPRNRTDQPLCVYK